MIYLKAIMANIRRLNRLRVPRCRAATLRRQSKAQRRRRSRRLRSPRLSGLLRMRSVRSRCRCTQWIQSSRVAGNRERRQRKEAWTHCFIPLPNSRATPTYRSTLASTQPSRYIKLKNNMMNSKSATSERSKRWWLQEPNSLTKPGHTPAAALASSFKAVTTRR